LQEATAPGAVSGAILDPAPGEILIVEVAPVVKTRDGLVDGLLAIASPAQPISHLSFGAGAVGEKHKRRISRPGALIVRKELGDSRCVEHITNFEVFVRNQVGR
jgi:hypothetical protein